MTYLGEMPLELCPHCGQGHWPEDDCTPPELLEWCDAHGMVRCDRLYPASKKAGCIQNRRSYSIYDELREGWYGP